MKWLMLAVALSWALGARGQLSRAYLPVWVGGEAPSPPRPFGVAGFAPPDTAEGAGSSESDADNFLRPEERAREHARPEVEEIGPFRSASGAPRPGGGSGGLELADAAQRGAAPSGQATEHTGAEEVTPSSAYSPLPSRITGHRPRGRPGLSYLPPPPPEGPYRRTPTEFEDVPLSPPFPSTGSEAGENEIPHTRPTELDDSDVSPYSPGFGDRIPSSSPERGQRPSGSRRPTEFEDESSASAGGPGHGADDQQEDREPVFDDPRPPPGSPAFPLPSSFASRRPVGNNSGPADTEAPYSYDKPTASGQPGFPLPSKGRPGFSSDDVSNTVQSEGLEGAPSTLPPALPGHDLAQQTDGPQSEARPDSASDVRPSPGASTSDFEGYRYPRPTDSPAFRLPGDAAGGSGAAPAAVAELGPRGGGDNSSRPDDAPASGRPGYAPGSNIDRPLPFSEPGSAESDQSPETGGYDYQRPAGPQFEESPPEYGHTSQSGAPGSDSAEASRGPGGIPPGLEEFDDVPPSRRPPTEFDSPESDEAYGGRPGEDSAEHPLPDGGRPGIGKFEGLHTMSTPSLAVDGPGHISVPGNVNGPSRVESSEPTVVGINDVPATRAPDNDLKPPRPEDGYAGPSNAEAAAGGLSEGDLAHSSDDKQTQSGGYDYTRPSGPELDEFPGTSNRTPPVFGPPGSSGAPVSRPDNRPAAPSTSGVSDQAGDAPGFGEFDGSPFSGSDGRPSDVMGEVSGESHSEFPNASPERPANSGEDRSEFVTANYGFNSEPPPTKVQHSETHVRPGVGQTEANDYNPTTSYSSDKQDTNENVGDTSDYRPSNRTTEHESLNSDPELPSGYDYPRPNVTSPYGPDTGRPGTGTPNDIPSHGPRDKPLRPGDRLDNPETDPSQYANGRPHIGSSNDTSSTRPTDRPSGEGDRFGQTDAASRGLSEGRPQPETSNDTLFPGPGDRQPSRFDSEDSAQRPSYFGGLHGGPTTQAPAESPENDSPGASSKSPGEVDGYRYPRPTAASAHGQSGGAPQAGHSETSQPGTGPPASGRQPPVNRLESSNEPGHGPSSVAGHPGPHSATPSDSESGPSISEGHTSQRPPATPSDDSPTAESRPGDNSHAGAPTTSPGGGDDTSRPSVTGSPHGSEGGSAPQQVREGPYRYDVPSETLELQDSGRGVTTYGDASQRAGGPAVVSSYGPQAGAAAGPVPPRFSGGTGAAPASSRLTDGRDARPTPSRFPIGSARVPSRFPDGVEAAPHHPHFYDGANPSRNNGPVRTPSRFPDGVDATPHLSRFSEGADAASASPRYPNGAVRIPSRLPEGAHAAPAPAPAHHTDTSLQPHSSRFANGVGAVSSRFSDTTRAAASPSRFGDRKDAAPQLSRFSAAPELAGVSEGAGNGHSHVRGSLAAPADTADRSRSQQFNRSNGEYRPAGPDVEGRPGASPAFQRATGGPGAGAGGLDREELAGPETGPSGGPPPIRPGARGRGKATEVDALNTGTRPPAGAGGASSGGGGSSSESGNRVGADELDFKYEPAKYEFSYRVEYPPLTVDFGHHERRVEEQTQGEYFVLLPDGRTQVVEYEADQEGYKPVIRYQGTPSKIFQVLGARPPSIPPPLVS